MNRQSTKATVPPKKSDKYPFHVYVYRRICEFLVLTSKNRDLIRVSRNVRRTPSAIRTQTLTSVTNILMREFVATASLYFSFALAVSVNSTSYVHRGKLLYFRSAPYCTTAAQSLYKEYTDDTYTTEKEAPEWAGNLGPIIRAEVGDTIMVHFKNMLPE